MHMHFIAYSGLLWGAMVLISRISNLTRICVTSRPEWCSEFYILPTHEVASIFIFKRQACWVFLSFSFSLSLFLALMRKRVSESYDISVLVAVSCPPVPFTSFCLTLVTVLLHVEQMFLLRFFIFKCLFMQKSDCAGTVIFIWREEIPPEWGWFSFQAAKQWCSGACTSFSCFCCSSLQMLSFWHVSPLIPLSIFGCDS